jgi:hypothetical protein
MPASVAADAQQFNSSSLGSAMAWAGQLPERQRGGSPFSQHTAIRQRVSNARQIVNMTGSAAGRKK